MNFSAIYASISLWPGSAPGASGEAAVLPEITLSIAFLGHRVHKTQHIRKALCRKVLGRIHAPFPPKWCSFFATQFGVSCLGRACTRISIVCAQVIVAQQLTLSDAWTCEQRPKALARNLHCKSAAACMVSCILQADPADTGVTVSMVCGQTGYLYRGLDRAGSSCSSQRDHVAKPERGCGDGNRGGGSPVTSRASGGRREAAGDVCVVGALHGW